MGDALAAWLTGAVSKYGAIVAGLAIGTAAKYGLTMTEGKRLTWRGVLIDLLLLGMLGALAIAIADSFSLTGNARVLAGALTAVSSDRLVRLVRDRFLQRADRDLTRGLALPPDTAAEITPRDNAAPVVKARVAPEAAPPARRELRTAYPPPVAEDPEIKRLLGKLNLDESP